MPASIDHGRPACCAAFGNGLIRKSRIASAHISVSEDWWRVKIPVDGQTIDSIDFGFSLALRTNRSCEIRIESDFEVNEANLVFPFGPDFEAWTIAGLDGMRVVSVAGGGLAVCD
ncbi:MAG: hypothetical protein WBG14_19085 [Rhodococcus sp. (in: high G+C Gram-positive bacteria)]